MQPDDTEIEKIIDVTKKCAQIILENGGETYRAEETVYRICKAFGFKNDVIALPVGVFISVSKNGRCENTAIKRIKTHTVNLTAINEVNDISRKLTGGALTLSEASERLCLIFNKKPGGKFISILSAGLSSGLFALLFRGSLLDFAIATVCGMVVRFVANHISSADMFNFAVSILGGVEIGLISTFAVKIIGAGDVDKIITGALMPLLPGISMINAIRDTMRGDLVSGVAGFAQATLTAVALAFGIGIVLIIYYAIF